MAFKVFEHCIARVVSYVPLCLLSCVSRVSERFVYIYICIYEYVYIYIYTHVYVCIEVCTCVSAGIRSKRERTKRGVNGAIEARRKEPEEAIVVFVRSRTKEWMRIGERMHDIWNSSRIDSNRL